VSLRAHGSGLWPGRGHVWMAPGSQGLFRVRGPQVACGHVSGLSSRHRPQAPMGSVDRGL